MKQRWKFKEPHYAELAKWSERVALALFVSVIIGGFIEQARITTGALIAGSAMTVLGYYFAANFLAKS
jgi:hypothetical protein